MLVVMSEYIALDVLGSSNESLASQELVFRRPTEKTPLINNAPERKVHSGYGASRLPLKPTSAGAYSGSVYDPIFQGQLGAAASSNPLGFNSARDQYYASVPWELRRLPLKARQEKIKPYGEEWTVANIVKYPEHWNLLNQNQKKSNNQPNLARGEPPRRELTLPFSNNIGPGNPIRPAANRADLIAQGHDIHYQEAKKPDDVLQADREAISQFAHEAVQGSDPISRLHAAVGGIGLGIKHTVEQLTGQVYYGKICQEYVHSVLIPRTDPIGVR